MPIGEQQEPTGDASSSAGGDIFEIAAVGDMGPQSSVPGIFPDGLAGSLSCAIDDLRAEIARLRGDLVSRLLSDETKKKAFDRLYADLDRARADSEFEQLRPLFVDLILLFDRVDKAVTETVSSDADKGELGALIISLREELLEILNRRGIELIEPSPRLFDPALQRVIGTRVANDSDEQNSIAAIVRRGFRKDRRLIRAEEVIVRKHSRNSTQEISHDSELQTSFSNES